MILLLDNYDSFTNNLAHYLRVLGTAVLVRRPQQLTLAEWEQPWTGVLLSPGPGLPKDAFASSIHSTGPMPTSAPANLLEAVEWFVQRRVPLLGICLGHQAIGQWAGATLRKGQQPVHGKRYALHHNNLGLYTGVPSPHQVVRYHSWLLDADSLPHHIVCDAWCMEFSIDKPEKQLPASSFIGPAMNRAVMAIRHLTLPIWGVQYHPEAALTNYGLQVLNNWLSEIGAHGIGNHISSKTLPADQHFAALSPQCMLAPWLQMR